jgi:hypothetical protein
MLPEVIRCPIPSIAADEGIPTGSQQAGQRIENPLRLTLATTG